MMKHGDELVPERSLTIGDKKVVIPAVHYDDRLHAQHIFAPQHQPATRVYPEKAAAPGSRMDPDACQHHQIWDKVFPYTGYCLDCGAEIQLGSYRRTKPGEQLLIYGEQEYHEHYKLPPKPKFTAEGNVLPHDELDALRAKFHDFWELAV